jgi:hypothetical protein
MRITFSLCFLFLLALPSYGVASTEADSARYSERLRIISTPQGPSIVGIFDKYGAGLPSLETCSQVPAQTNSYDQLDSSMQAALPASGCSSPHCPVESVVFGDCITNQKPYLRDCNNNLCASYYCTPTSRGGCCVQCERTDIGCYGCKTTGYCN